MSVAMNIWSLVAIVIVSMLTGFFAGRTGGQEEKEERPEKAGENLPDAGESQERPDISPEQAQPKPERPFRKEGKRIPIGWSIGSPVAGQVAYFYEGNRRGAMIKPEEGLLYAPAPGKIVKLYPTGNALRLRTDYGVELLIQVGVGTNELEGLYFRPRAVQNEVVRKGKPLLEFDLAAIAAEGYDTSVTMSVEDAENYRDITVTEVKRVRNGEDLLWVRQ